MHSLVLYILSVFAVFRAARMIAIEDGPGNVFQDVRGSLMRAPAWVQSGATCPLCLGFWLALVPALLIGFPSPLVVLGLWFAIAGGQAFLWDLVSK